MSGRIRSRVRTNPKICQRCGSRLRPEVRRRFDAFSVVLLISLGAALAFYLIGLLIIAAGLWFWTRHQTYWVCPACSREPGTANLAY